MVEMGRVGVWSGLRSWDPGAVGAAAAAVESSGYGALWIPGGAGGDVLDRCRDVSLYLVERSPEWLDELD